MQNPIVLYSTNTWLAYNITETYYSHEHYVWCSPYFSSQALSGHDYSTPPTSTPCEIYNSILKEVISGDRHSFKVKENKVGILKGAYHKEKAGVITAKQRAEIAAIVKRAETRDFKPLLYIIPFNLVSNMIEEVSIQDRAHPFSVEYRIEYLPRQLFDIITFTWS